MLWDYIVQRKMVAHRQALLYHFLILFFLVSTYLVLFSWMPALLLRPSLIAGYYIYTIPDITYMIPLVNVFPVISVALSTLILYFTYKYRLVISSTRNIEISFDRSMQVASQSMRVYAHSMKNQIANAVDAIAASNHPGEGEMVIRIHNHAKWLIFTVEDNGCGMTPEVSSQIFEPFYSTKSSSTNWGMGLSLCQKIMAAHHGSITVESVPNVGSRFDLALPCI